MSERSEKVRASQIPGSPAFGRDPDDPTWSISSRTYPEWEGTPLPERLAALQDAAFLEEMAASFLAVRVEPKGKSRFERGHADAMTSVFAWKAERLHLIAQRLRGMQP